MRKNHAYESKESFANYKNVRNHTYIILCFQDIRGITDGKTDGLKSSFFCLSFINTTEFSIVFSSKPGSVQFAANVCLKHEKYF